LKIELRKPDNSDYEPKDVYKVEIYLRCDVSDLYHEDHWEVRGTDDPYDKPVSATPRFVGGQICGTMRMKAFTGGTKFTIVCTAPIMGAKEIWIQKTRLPTTLHSHGSGWPNFNGNQWNSYTGNAPAQNSNWLVTEMAINEVVLY